MIPSFSNILSIAKDIENVSGILREKLLNNPTEASAKLADVLGELSLILEFIEKETVRYLEIIFLQDKSNLIQCRSALLSLESGYTTIKGFEARGHCHKINNIYEKYLDRWFSKVLDPTENQKLKSLFDRFTNSDSDLIEGINEITTWLKEESEAILQMVDADQLDSANQRIKNARLAIQQTRRDIVQGLAQMKLLQSSFIASSQSI